MKVWYSAERHGASMFTTLLYTGTISISIRFEELVKKIILIFFILTLLCTQSCFYTYVNNVHNTPLFTKKNEIQLSSNVKLRGLEAHLAASPKENMGIIINTYFGLYRNPNTKFGEIGIGWWDNSDKSHIGFYGGYGIGFVDIYGTQGKWEVGAVGADCWHEFFGKSEYHRFFLQAILGQTPNNNVSFGASLRTNLVYFVNLDYNDNRVCLEWSESYPWDQSEYSSNLKNVTLLTLDPIIFVKVGYKFTKFEWQIGYSFPSDDRDPFIYPSFTFNGQFSYFFERRK